MTSPIMDSFLADFLKKIKNIETLKKIDIELTLIIEYVFNVFIFIIDIVSNLMFMIRLEKIQK